MKTNFENFFEAMNEMVKDNRSLLERKVDYDTFIDRTGIYMLRINYKHCYDKVLAYCLEKDIPYPSLSLEEFKLILRSKNYCVCYNMPMWFNRENTGGRLTTNSTKATLNNVAKQEGQLATNSNDTTVTLGSKEKRGLKIEVRGAGLDVAMMQLEGINIDNLLSARSLTK